jgi:hypothetical protein
LIGASHIVEPVIRWQRAVSSKAALRGGLCFLTPRKFA